MKLEVMFVSDDRLSSLDKPYVAGQNIRVMWRLVSSKLTGPWCYSRFRAIWNWARVWCGFQPWEANEKRSKT